MLKRTAAAAAAAAEGRRHPLSLPPSVCSALRDTTKPLLSCRRRCRRRTSQSLVASDGAQRKKSIFIKNELRRSLTGFAPSLGFASVALLVAPTRAAAAALSSARRRQADEDFDVGGRLNRPHVGPTTRSRSVTRAARYAVYYRHLNRTKVQQQTQCSGKSKCACIFVYYTE